VAPTSVAVTSVAPTWSLTILALINMALTSALCEILKMPVVINLTDKCDSDMDSGSDKVQKVALTSASSGYQVFLLRSIYLGHLV